MEAETGSSNQSNPLLLALKAKCDYDAVTAKMREKELQAKAIRRCIAELKAQRVLKDTTKPLYSKVIDAATPEAYTAKDIAHRREQERGKVLQAAKQYLVAHPVPAAFRVDSPDPLWLPMPVLRLGVIGHASTTFNKRFEAPRQPFLGQAEASLSTIVVSDPASLPAVGPGDHMWVLFWFDRNAHFRNHVLAPRATRRHGTFATRTPHRPNPVGLTLVRVAGVEGASVTMEGADLLDGTPIIGLRRYIPGAGGDSRSDGARGWLAAETIPLHYDDVKRPTDDHEVAGLTAPPIASRLGRVQAVHPALDVLGLVRTTLARHATLDHTRRVGEKRPDPRHPGLLALSVGSFRVLYHVAGSPEGAGRVTVVDVVSGLPEKLLDDPRDAMGRAHRAFRDDFPALPRVTQPDTQPTQ